jgi:hypothetical protein
MRSDGCRVSDYAFSIQIYVVMFCLCLFFVCLFVGVSMATITGKPPGVFMRPACPTCGSRILLVRIS